jgi:hypothetical protein
MCCGDKVANGGNRAAALRARGRALLLARERYLSHGSRHRGDARRPYDVHLICRDGRFGSEASVSVVCERSQLSPRKQSRANFAATSAMGQKLNSDGALIVGRNEMAHTKRSQ